MCDWAKRGYWTLEEQATFLKSSQCLYIYTLNKSEKKIPIQDMD